jgi:hypothetical protein
MVGETLITDLNYWGNAMRDAAIKLQHQQNELNIARRLLEEGLAFNLDETWCARVQDYLMHA